MATDRELAARSMTQAGIGSLSGRPNTTYRDKINQITANAQAAQLGNWNWEPTTSQIRQDAINRGQRVGLPNRISFAGESGRDILNPNEMRDNAPSYEDWKDKAQRKIWMDRMYQQPDNPYYGQDQNWGSSAGITNPNLNGYKVMNAGMLDSLKRFFFGDNDIEDEFYGLAPPSEDFEEDEWRRGNADLQYNRAQINMNESLVRQRERDMYHQFLKEGKKPHRTPDGALWPQYNAIPVDPDVHDQFPNFAPGLDWLHQQTYPNIQEPETIEASAQGLAGTEVAQSKWKEKFQSIIDMIMNRENLDERGARKFVFDNYGLTV